MTIKEVAAYFGCSDDTIRRRIAESRSVDEANGKAPKSGQKPLPFPLPITSPGKMIKFDRDDIESLNPNNKYRPESPRERAIEQAVIKNRLAKHGIHLN